MNKQLERLIDICPIYERCYVCQHYCDSFGKCLASDVNCKEEIYKQIVADIKKETIDEILSILISDTDFGHETFSLTYLKGLLKGVKERK